MSFSSDRFRQTRVTSTFATGNDVKAKDILSFKKFIKLINQNISINPEYVIASEFNFYDVNCENCQQENKKIVSMYLLSSKELELILAKEQDIDENRADLILKCPECYQEKRVIDMRKHIAINPAIQPLDETLASNNEGIGDMINVSFDRDKKYNPLNQFEETIKQRLEELLAMPTKNKQAKEELKKYIKEYAAINKEIPKVLKSEYNSLKASGQTLLKVENIQL